MSISKFNLEFSISANRINSALKKTIAEASEDLVDKIVKTTPVKTGRLRGNWTAMLNDYESAKFTNRYDKSGSTTFNRAKEVLSAYKLTDEIFISNNLEYAEKIEYGYSAQSPYGMVRVSVRSFDVFLELRAQQNKV